MRAQHGISRSIFHPDRFDAAAVADVQAVQGDLMDLRIVDRHINRKRAAEGGPAMPGGGHTVLGSRRLVERRDSIPDIEVSRNSVVAGIWPILLDGSSGGSAQVCQILSA